MEPTPDYIVNLTATSMTPQNDRDTSERQAAEPTDGRQWLSIWWRCCHVYGRIYRDQTHQAYRGGCPKCGKVARVGIGQGGSSQRFFEAR